LLYLAQPFALSTKFIRIKPISYNAAPSMRVELHGRYLADLNIPQISAVDITALDMTSFKVSIKVSV